MRQTSAGHEAWHVGHREVVRFRSLSMKAGRGGEFVFSNGSTLEDEVDAEFNSISMRSMAAHAADEQNSDRD